MNAGLKDNLIAPRASADRGVTAPCSEAGVSVGVEGPELGSSCAQARVEALGHAVWDAWARWWWRLQPV